MGDDDMGHASSVLEQLKQAQADGDLPDELAEEHDLDEDSEDADPEADDA